VQHACPSPPQVPQALLKQMPRAGVPPQLWVSLTHDPPTQQRRPQAELWQHGWLAFPQATTVPSRQTLPVVGDSPRAAHVPPVQQPPPRQAVAPAQQA
jgi:hypothetical protein